MLTINITIADAMVFGIITYPREDVVSNIIACNGAIRAEIDNYHANLRLFRNGAVTDVRSGKIMCSFISKLLEKLN